MKHKIQAIHPLLLAGIYFYLAIPNILFFLGWCKWYIGIPATGILLFSVWKCLQTNKATLQTKWLFSRQDYLKIAAALLLILGWVTLSGVGGYVWQNSDHWWRNTIFDLLVTEQWPVQKAVTLNGVTLQRGMVYYIGFWLPAALIGKAFGIHAGYSAQYLWAVLGILLLYGLLCTWRKKVLIWPLVLFIFFSGLDIVGTLCNTSDTFSLFGTEHLERWPYIYQFSGITTQLFWVFNQAITAWLVSALLFLLEKPKNMVFVWALTMISATFPFVGLLPYVLYLMITESRWTKETSYLKIWREILRNWFSIPNVLGGGCVGILCAVYLLGNMAGQETSGSSLLFLQTGSLQRNRLLFYFALLLGCALLLIAITEVVRLIHKGKSRLLWRIFVCVLCFVFGIAFLLLLQRNNVRNTYLFFGIFFLLFYFLEVGIYQILLYKGIEEKGLFFLNATWLFVIPHIIIGSSIDFCMRASIPGIVLIILWCIEVLEQKRKELSTVLLIAALLLGSVTSFHEMKRTLVNTWTEYTLDSVPMEDIMGAENFSGSVDTFFWRYISKK